MSAIELAKQILVEAGYLVIEKAKLPLDLIDELTTPKANCFIYFGSIGFEIRLGFRDNLEFKIREKYIATLDFFKTLGIRDYYEGEYDNFTLGSVNGVDIDKEFDDYTKLHEYLTDNVWK